jgi:hypothetical protein
MLFISLISSVLFAGLLQNGQGFVIPLQTRTTGSSSSSSSRLFLEKWVAELIDQELDRQGHKPEYERTWMEKNREAVVVKTDIEPNYMMLDDDDLANLRQRRKDELLAKNDPQRYCADRCIATGNCDVFEDLYVCGNHFASVLGPGCCCWLLAAGLFPIAKCTNSRIHHFLYCLLIYR